MKCATLLLEVPNSRAVMKASKGDFTKAESEPYGQRWDYANVCTRCHTHKNTPFKPEVHDKYKFNFEERKLKSP